jgi:bifunctional NMN adenylyltransferase/nudix hydrolase
MLSVIIGRFQTPHLHEGHQELIRAANNFSQNVLVLIGCTAAIGTDKNPLDFETRKKIFENRMLCEIKPLHDMVSDYDWSDQIDKIIDDLGFKEATIFGGKDNSIEGYYHGKHRIKIINPIGIHSATALRKAVGMSNPRSSEDFRAGIIYAAENRYPIVYSTVDVIIKNGDKYLVGKKGNKYCFIGGFVDPSDRNLFEAAIREAREETGITSYGIGFYAGSIKIDDERYKGTKDSIMTHCFITEVFEEVNYDKIQDKEFKDFVWATREGLEELLHDFHKPLLTFIF